MQQIIDYFLEVQSYVKGLDIIETADIEYEVKARNLGIIHGMISFIDGSTLHFMELAHIRGEEINRLKYRFHWIDANAEMTFRYDNAPHHPEVGTYPHHKHRRGEEKPEESKEVGLIEILAEINEAILG